MPVGVQILSDTPFDGERLAFCVDGGLSVGALHEGFQLIIEVDFAAQENRELGEAFVARAELQRGGFDLGFHAAAEFAFALGKIASSLSASSFACRSSRILLASSYFFSRSRSAIFSARFPFRAS
jgi:hypothetical protein